MGDDPGCKSSTIPSASESLLSSLHMPVFYPGNVQEVLDLGLHALACSRASGLWGGFKIVTSVADALGTATVARDRVMPVMPTVEWNGKPYEHVPNANLLAPASLDMEQTLFGPRTELALAYARENGVNRIEGAERAWLGIACAGKPYYDLMHALRGLGLDGPGLERAGIRILKLGMLWPVEPEIAREFAQGLDEILVAEEKGPFLETHLKETLYGVAGAPRILGKRDEQRRAAPPARARPRRRPDRARHRRPARGARRADRLGRGAPPEARRDPRSPGRAADGGSAPRSSAPAARTTAPCRRPRARSWAPASAATRWSC